MDAIVKYDGKDVVFCDLQQQDFIEGLLLAGSWYELSNLEFIRNLNAKGNYCDVGAYIGTHSIFFSLFCSATQVYSFEPQIGVYQKLVHNIAANNITNCQAFNLGLSDVISRGTADGPDTNKGGAWLRSGDDVSVVTLDSLNLQGVTLLKVDVEGMELHALKGAETTLGGVEHLFVEMWSEASCKAKGCAYTVDSVVKFLEPLGFRCQERLVEDLFYFRKV